MYQFANDGSYSEEVLYAGLVQRVINTDYSFKHEEYPNVYIPNRSLMWAISFCSEESEEKKRLREQVGKYNSYIDRLNRIEGFGNYFVRNGLCVTKEDVAKEWDQKTAEIVFSLPEISFKPGLTIIDNYFFDYQQTLIYSTVVNGTEIKFPLGEWSNAYPEMLNKYKLLWNWMDNGHDFCYFIWKILGERFSKDEVGDVVYNFDAYEQFRDEDPKIQLKLIFTKLEKLGYIKACTIRPKVQHPMWKEYAKSDGSIDIALVNMKFLNNKLLMEHIELLLWANEELLKGKTYFLTDKNNKQYVSRKPGNFGGNYRLKIYGRIDCPSANRYVAKGKYIQHRVFFTDEETAIAAGYRPCAKCMPEQYKKWKKRISS